MSEFPYRLDRTVVIHARPEVVFRFFTDSGRWASWWGPGSTIDARPGGHLLIVHPGPVQVVGEVIEVMPPERIVFSYGFASGTPIPPAGSRVAIHLEPIGSSTRLHLSHGFSEQAAREEFIQGWRFQLSLFGNVISNEIHRDAAAVVDGWFSAWAVPEAASRREAFARVASPGVQLRDRFSLIEGLDDLVAHTGAYQRFFPGIRLERRGNVRQCQGSALADWISPSDDGEPRMTGSCCFALTPDNQIDTVTNFITLSSDPTDTK